MNLDNKKSVINVPAGKAIFLPEKSQKYLFLVKKGEVRLVKQTGQRLAIVGVCKEKEILNEIGILTNQGNDYGAIAKTDVELVAVDGKEINSVIKKCPVWVSEIFQTLCERLKHSQEVINEHNLNSQSKDNAMVLTKDEEKNYLAAFENFKPLV